MGALVLAVDLDDLTLGRVKAAVRETELSVHAVSPESAIERAQKESGPIIGMLEWSGEHEAEQTRLCEELRRAARPGHCYIVALGGVADPALARAMESAANDVLIRPFGDELLPRLRRALYTMRSEHAAVTPRDALDEALASTSSSGEIVVRAGEIVGHIHVQNGFVVWANLSSVPSTIEEIARHAGVDLEPEVIAAAKEESRIARIHVMDVLVGWKLIDPERAKEAVRTFVAERVNLVLDLPGASALFLPKVRRSTEGLRFGVDDIPSLRRPVLNHSVAPYASLPPTSSRTPPPLGEISLVFQAATKIEGAISVAILDRTTGASLLLSGAEIDTGVAWSQLSLLAALGRSADDVIGSTGDSCFVTRPLPEAPTLALFVVFSRSATTIGLARAMIAGIFAARARSSDAK